ncbi:hypothetical protein KIN20_021148 [Parelaphostrongylus tenuis]|uniref:Uncharacterized protein n=1 Tax=Parelaphostrongylus tenuis TaxID=148309 RepID=A0AAD5N6T0_PARTN|nr:hypothetical protein KIN20_021148 [Parelaphostrongylus tenuis]
MTLSVPEYTELNRTRLSCRRKMSLGSTPLLLNGHRAPLHSRRTSIAEQKGAVESNFSTSVCWHHADNRNENQSQAFAEAAAKKSSAIELIMISSAMCIKQIKSIAE